MRRLLLFATALAIVMTCLPARAQDTQADAEKKARMVAMKQSLDQMVRDKISIELKTATSGVLGPVVTGAPYSAVTTNESIQTLADGNRIVQRSSYNVARDGQGRVRREELNDAGAVVSIMIMDPVSNVTYVLDPAQRTAQKISLMSARTGGWPTGESAGVAYSVTPKVVAEQKMRAGTVTTFRVNGETVNMLTPEARGANVQRESLGAQNIESVNVEGTRTVITLPAGQIGNERPIETVSEQWYSKDLQMTVMSRQSDPRTGEATYRVSNIRRGEPDASLFQLPADYTVVRSEVVGATSRIVK